MSRHEAEQFEMPLVESPENPILDLITTAKTTLEELKAVEKHGCSMLTISEGDLLELETLRIQRTEELQKLVMYLKHRFLRRLGKILLTNEKEK